MRIKHANLPRHSAEIQLPRETNGDRVRALKSAQKEVSPKALRYCWHRPVRRRRHWSTCVKGECIKLAPSRHHGMSAQMSLTGDKRTTYAQCEFFAF
jgi:hypothetical protein